MSDELDVDARVLVFGILFPMSENPYDSPSVSTAGFDNTGDRALLGRRVLIGVIIVALVGEVALAGMYLHAGQFRFVQIVRMLLTGWLFWQVWEGARWARWLMAGLCLSGAVPAGLVLLASIGGEERPEVLAIMVGIVAVLVGLGFALASPWVGAYQAVRRGSGRTS